VTGLWAHCSPKIERWRLYLERWKPFEIVHIRGTAAEQAVADGLSRLHARNLNDMATAEISDEESRLAAELGEGGADERLFSNSSSMRAAWTSLSSRAPVVAAASASKLEVEAVEEVTEWEEDEGECEVLAAPAPLEAASQPASRDALSRGQFSSTAGC